jgi:hypothetical protein
MLALRLGEVSGLEVVLKLNITNFRIEEEKKACDQFG